jgi:hypothetical protein
MRRQMRIGLALKKKKTLFKKNTSMVKKKTVTKKKMKIHRENKVRLSLLTLKEVE